MSRSNDITITVHPGPDQQHRDRVDQVRNGNRWRVVALDPDTNRIAAERLSDSARVVFDSDYLTEARHAGLCGDRALGARRHRRQLLRDPRRGRITGDAVRGDDPRTPQQRSVPLPTHHQRSRPRARQTGLWRRNPHLLGEATNTQPHTTSGRSWPTTTGPAPCTPKPNAPSDTCFPRWSPISCNATTHAAAPAGPPGSPTSGPPRCGSPATSSWPRPPNEPPPLISIPVDLNCDPTLGGFSAPWCNCAVHGWCKRNGSNAFETVREQWKGVCEWLET